MTGWQRDKQRADVFMPQIRSILGRLFISDAPLEIDQTQATDLMVLTLAPVTIGVRMRDTAKGYLSQYPFDITIRHTRPSGARSEWDKIVDGWGDYLFYGFGDFTTGKVTAYTILDLKAFRALLVRSGSGEAAGPFIQEQSNRDGSSTFKAVDWRSLPTSCIRHQYPSDWRQFVEVA